MRRPAVALVLAMTLAAAGCTPHRAALGQPEAAPPTAPSPLAVDSTLRVMARPPLWPGFSPLATPVAIFDGTRTFLFRHPSPPPGYAALEGRSDVAVRNGRDPAITANTSATLGGVSTATVMLDSRSSVADAAALTVHELFHVFQRARHPSWQGNEADLFTYPVDDTVALALRREEWAALRAALGVTRVGSGPCWARDFVRVRARRFAAVGAAAATYERGTELNEGLARYVEWRARGRPVTLDASDPPASQVRQRAYAVGAALAALLDSTGSDWRAALERRDSAGASLDAMVADAVGDPEPTLFCEAWGGKRVEWATEAADEVRALRAERARDRADYLVRPGWRIVVESGATPFFPQGFDPLNVARLSPTEILHTRFVKLQGTLGTIEVLAGSALTEGTPGQHPLFAGVRRVTIAGLATPPSMSDSAGMLAVNAAGVVIRLRGAKADVTGETIRLAPR